MAFLFFEQKFILSQRVDLGHPHSLPPSPPSDKHGWMVKTILFFALHAFIEVVDARARHVPNN